MKIIDFSTPMKTEDLCGSTDETGCCGCFKEKTDKCEDKRCVPITKTNKKGKEIMIHRECVKKEETVSADMFHTGKKCNRKKDCLCHQKCKNSRKCKKLGGECLGKAPEWDYKQDALIQCYRQKKCNCYIPANTDIIIGD